MRNVDLNQIIQLTSIALEKAKQLHKDTEIGLLADIHSDRSELGNVVYRLEITLASLGRLKHRWEAVPILVEFEDSDEITDRIDMEAVCLGIGA